MTAKEANAIANTRMAVVNEANEIYTKIQKQIRECANQGLYRTTAYIDSDSYDAVVGAVGILKDCDGFKCCLEYKSGKASIQVSWEHAQEE